MRPSPLAMCAPYLALAHLLLLLAQISPYSSDRRREAIWQSWGCHLSNEARFRSIAAEKVLRVPMLGLYQARAQNDEAVFSGHGARPMV